MTLHSGKVSFEVFEEVQLSPFDNESFDTEHQTQKYL